MLLSLVIHCDEAMVKYSTWKNLKFELCSMSMRTRSRHCIHLQCSADNAMSAREEALRNASASRNAYMLQPCCRPFLSLADSWLSRVLLT